MEYNEKLNKAIQILTELSSQNKTPKEYKDDEKAKESINRILAIESIENGIEHLTLAYNILPYDDDSVEAMMLSNLIDQAYRIIDHIED